MSDPQVTVEFGDPNVGTDRADAHAAFLARQAREDALRARVPQIRAMYPKLLAGTATSREVQGALAFILRWMQVQETD